MKYEVIDFEIVEELIEPKIDGCPWDNVTAFAWQIVDMYGHYESGHLWYNNVISWNPAWYVKTMRYFKGIYNNELAKHEKAETPTK